MNKSRLHKANDRDEELFIDNQFILTQEYYKKVNEDENRLIKIYRLANLFDQVFQKNTMDSSNLNKTIT